MASPALCWVMAATNVPYNIGIRAALRGFCSPVTQEAITDRVRNEITLKFHDGIS